MPQDKAEHASAESKTRGGFSPRRFYLYQKPMIQVVIATVPAVLGAVYFFGWRSLSVLVLSIVLGSLTEWLFCRARNERVSSAVLVTAILYSLTLPPRVPYMVVAVGIVVAVVFGKEVFGGFGRNVFNPALVGRCFIYVCFPVVMTSQWLPSYEGLPGGFARWVGGLDAITRATPLAQYRSGEAAASLKALLLGNVGGCLGETSALLILAGGAYLLVKRTANWRIVVSCVVGGALVSAVFHYAFGSPRVPDPLFTILSGGFLFGSFFMATDPISASQTDEGRVIYGFAVGALTVVIRGFSNFAGGIMFAILFMNIFNPIIDHCVGEAKRLRQDRAERAQAKGRP